MFVLVGDHPDIKVRNNAYHIELLHHYLHNRTKFLTLFRGDLCFDDMSNIIAKAVAEFMTKRYRLKQKEVLVCYHGVCIQAPL